MGKYKTSAYGQSGIFGEINKVRVGDIGRKGFKQYWHEVYNGIEPVHKNKFDEFMYKDDFHEYDWEALKTSLLEEGYNTKKYKPITVRPSHEEFKYFIIDGQHRAFLLRQMFGEDHMIDVIVKGDKSKPKKPITEYVRVVNNLLFPVYCLIYHTIPLILIIFSHYIITKYLPGNQMYKKLKKGLILNKINKLSGPLYIITLNIINNMQVILYIGIMVIIAIYALIVDFYGIIAISTLSALITYLLPTTKKEEKIDK
tara:strand:- start:1449 stop:2216 length:768 start_codon:yes stop_codon:yes gene_type:complete